MNSLPGFSLFETMLADANGDVVLFDDHLARLQRSAARLGLPFAPPTNLRAMIRNALREQGHAPAVLRLQCTPTTANQLDWSLTTRALPRREPFVRLIPCVVQREPDAPPADLKATPRDFYDALRQEARAAGADDGIALGRDGAVLETSIANLWLVFDQGWVTPPLDGRILPGIARARLLARLPSLGIPVRERPCSLADLHAARNLLISNAVRGLQAAHLLGSPPPAVAIPDTELQQLWRNCC